MGDQPRSKDGRFDFGSGVTSDRPAPMSSAEGRADQARFEKKRQQQKDDRARRPDAVGGGSVAQKTSSLERQMNSQPEGQLYGNSLPKASRETNIAVMKGMEKRRRKPLVRTEENVQVKDLNSSQALVSAKGMGFYAGGGGGANAPMKVVRYKGTLHVWDGNHRANVSFLTGQKTMPASVINLPDK